MSTIEVSIVISASPAVVWRRIEDIGGHVDWMADAESITFTSDQQRGTGTAFECATRVGPLRLTDRMVITAWEPEVAMGVCHDGVVTGSGRFTLEPVSGDRTRFTWREDLAFPWWLGGRLGAAVGAPVLRHIWIGNLTRLQELVESRPTPDP